MCVVGTFRKRSIYSKSIVEVAITLDASVWSESLSIASFYPLKVCAPPVSSLTSRPLPSTFAPPIDTWPCLVPALLSYVLPCLSGATGTQLPQGPPPSAEAVGTIEGPHASAQEKHDHNIKNG